MAKNVTEIMEVMRCSLLMSQHGFSEVHTAVKASVDELLKQKMLFMDENVVGLKLSLLQ